MRRAIIIGAHGQDGRLLGEQLELADRSLIKIGRGDIDLQDRHRIDALIGDLRPDEIYYLAAHHHSSQDPLAEDDATLFARSIEVNVTGLVHVLQAVRVCSPDTRVFYAASSHIFGQPATAMQSENTPFVPNGVYGITKAAGVQCCRYYRRSHGVFAATGILYNHESALRGAQFVSQKIILAARAIAAGSSERLLLGDLSARIDWGYAPDYVDAMRRILALPRADDFVVASGESHTVQEFVEAAFEAAGIDWRRHVAEDPGQINRQYRGLIGDASKLRAATGWKPSVSFRAMVRILFDADNHG